MTLISAEDRAWTSIAAEEAPPPATRTFTSLACSARHSAFTGASAENAFFSLAGEFPRMFEALLATSAAIRCYFYVFQAHNPP